ncbi:NADP-dependent oxidoreductase domain-containing protein [Tricladium varicosporioides]|nr:NADP-dependent oxidoreductase domain-containing protein [Hymenoscyphus varicosporioides]
MAAPKIIFGAGGIGTTEKGFTFTWDTAESVSALLSTLSTLNITELDGGASYPPGNPWNTETLLGDAKATEKGFVIDSKVAIHGGNRQDENGVSSSLNKSLQLLGGEKVRTLYSHMPDYATPIEATAAAYHKEFLAGKFERLGLSNYPPDTLEKYIEVCEANQYVKPTVYQGHYNAIMRGHEENLFPILRKHGIKYYAYSPLAGGFLTGKLTFKTRDTNLARTRWEGDSKMDYYSSTFDRPEIHSALQTLHAVCEKHNLSLTGVCLRWLMHHSQLGEGDGIILGAKRIDQLESNVVDCRKGPLPGELVKAVEGMWEEVKGLVKPTWM